MEGKEGKIYILRNPYLKDAIIKIGRTIRLSEKRAQEISGGTGVPAEFEVLYEEDVFDSHLAEKLIHAKLNEERINQRREFFRLPLKKAVRVVFETCLELNKNSLSKASTRILIAVNEQRPTRYVAREIAKRLSKHKGGNLHVWVLYESNMAKVLMEIGEEWNVSLTPDLVNELKNLKGVSYVFWTSLDLHGTDFDFDEMVDGIEF